MKLMRCLLALAAIISLGTTAAVFAADGQDNSRFDEELNERDFDALRDFLKTRKALDVAEKTSSLVISGDIRTEWRHLNESCKGERLRGGNAVGLNGRPLSRNDFDMEFNVYFMYSCDKTWAVAHVRYDNSAGVDDNGHPCHIDKNKTSGCCKDQAGQCNGDPEGYHGSGNCSDLCLKKAYMGYNLYTDNISIVDVELGRRGNLYNVFDSNIQFLSRFDGIVLKYDSSWECVADWYVHAAGFVVDERVNHFAWVAELGFLNIADTDIDFKYSIIDWEKHGTNRCFARNPAGFRFINSQFTLAYNVSPEAIGVPVKFFGAFLINHAAHKLHLAHVNSRQNIGWYAGVLFGKVVKEDDWALEVQYQVVEAQAMPDDDMGGIGRGNVLDESFTTCSRRGNTNFEGWKIEGLYAITDNLTIDSILEWSKAYNTHIGGSHKYSKFEIETVYAF